jgi:aspartyl/asparaginyl beta-hydroxylase (cupin superfamily)
MMKIIAFAKLGISYDADAMAREINELPSGWSPHFNVSSYSGKWEALSLRSVDGQVNTIIPHLSSSVTYYDTSLMDKCPSVKQLVSHLLCEVLSVRFMRLPAGSVIKEHTDPELSFEQGEVRLHFPLVTNEQVDFRVDKKRVVMPKGSAWYINANLPHSVSNAGASDRVHLVIDCCVNEWIHELFANSGKEYADLGKLRSQHLQVIESLRLHGTDTAMQLADKMEKELNENE